MNIVVTDSVEKLSSYREEWLELVREALEPNIFYEPVQLIPALKHLKAEIVLIVLIWLENENGRPLLSGLFPLTQRQTFRRLPLAHCALWNHLHCHLCTPLVRKESADETFSAFFSWLDENDFAGDLVSFDQISADGPFWSSLKKFLNDDKRNFDEADFHHRALLKSSLNGKSYLARALSSKKRKELRRQRKRLEELGRLRIKHLGPTEDCQPWIKQFLELEQTGWKGRKGTALAINPNEKKFFSEMINEAHDKKQLLFSKIRLGETPVAMKCSLVSGTSSFAIRIAYDEKYYRYSPGVLLEMENIHRIQTSSKIQWMDSCAIPNHPMINSLWTEKRSIKHLYISKKNFRGRALLSGTSRIKQLIQAATGSRNINEIHT